MDSFPHPAPCQHLYRCHSLDKYSCRSRSRRPPQILASRHTWIGTRDSEELLVGVVGFAGSAHFDDPSVLPETVPVLARMWHNHPVADRRLAVKQGLTLTRLSEDFSQGR